MNYRHAFHAGNFADAHKHAILSTVLSLMTAKDKPMVAVDVHAGAGRYDLLLDDRALRTGEWREGVERLIGARGIPAAAQDYLSVIGALNEGQPELRFYPGSTLLMAALTRPEDKIMACEIQPQERERLIANLGADRRTKVYDMDAYAALRAFLPPTPRRGLVLVDGPFEDAREHERMTEGIAAAIRRWETGVYLLWRPIKAQDRAATAYLRALARLPRPVIEARLNVRAPDGSGLSGSALAIVNPPFGLEERIEALSVWLTETLGQGPGAGWSLERLTRGS